MRWSIIHLIWLRELRDQLRDRRTIFMIAVLPILLYPVAGFGVMQLAIGFLNQRSIVGVAGASHLIPWSGNAPNPTPLRVCSWFALTAPPPGSSLAGVDRLATALAFHLLHSREDYPPLLIEENGKLSFSLHYTPRSKESTPLQLLPLTEPVPQSDDPEVLAAPYQQMLEDRKCDVVLVIPADFQPRLQAAEQPTLYLFSRTKEETSRLVQIRLSNLLNRWRHDLKEARLARLGLPPEADQPIRVYDPTQSRSRAHQEEENLFHVLVRIFPFILVMWSLAGALYPAVDLCAGEKERGTMETLLISPASREEIVWGKFLTIWLFSAGTALLNLLSMALTTAQLGAVAGAGLHLAALLWSVLLLLPLSAFFSAICLAVGAYARSSKEGQYYLMPLFLFTMPLIFLTLAPGVELNPFYSMVPVTGVALLLQRLVASSTPDRGVWFYFIPVLAPMVIYSWLALRWAIEQFNREEVLFREAERLDLGLWLKRLLREKENLPSPGEALFCFALILGLRWLSFGIGQQLSLLTQTAVAQVAFVAAPPLFMALILTTRPRLGVGLRLPPWWGWLASIVLAFLVVPPLAELTYWILQQFPALTTLLDLNHPLTRELRSIAGTSVWDRLRYFLVLAVLPAVCEELAFRGFIFQGLSRGFTTWRAVFLSAFLFALYQMNVFQFVPHFVFGVILGLLVVRTGSVLPAILFHLVYNTLVLTPSLFPEWFDLFLRVASPSESMPQLGLARLVFSSLCALFAMVGLILIWWLGRQLPPETSS